MAVCRAAVPVEAILEDGSSSHDWEECGRLGTAEHTYRCRHGHTVTAATCDEHVPTIGEVGCRACFDQGHECLSWITGPD